jgi:hypothetical protein
MVVFDVVNNPTIHTKGMYLDSATVLLSAYVCDLFGLTRRHVFQ